MPATALLVDLRHFTSNLKAARADEQGVNVYCRFLGRFYATCLDAALIAVPPGRREDPPLTMSSTGDGVLVLFTDPDWHFAHAYLAALVLHGVLGRTCEGYHRHEPAPGVPRTSFGIGVESGRVARIRAAPRNAQQAPVVDTYIGECINVAARVQEVTKLLYQAHTIIGADTNTLLCERLFARSYPELMQAAESITLTDGDRLALHGLMSDLNRRLCLAFLHQHQLRGVDRPLPLFRVSESAARLGNPRYEGLLRQLVRGDEPHLADVIATLRAAAD